MCIFRALLLTGSILLIYAPGLWAQDNFSTPNIRSIPPEEYQAKIQNWHAAQPSSGLMYIANLGGVLEYDGEHWRTIDLPNTTALSVGIYNDTVFVGGVGEIGYLYHSSKDSAHTRYRSLTNRLPELHSDFGDVWQAIPTADCIYFRTGKYLYRYRNGKFEHWKSKTGFHFAFNVKDELYINVRQKGLHKMLDGELQLVKKGEIFAEDGIYAMLPYGEESILIATRYKNLAIYDGTEVRDFRSDANIFLEENQLYNGLQLSDGSFVFGTLQNGIIRINQKGDVLNIINKERGLLDDVIYNLFEDREGNLWVSQNKGLSIVNILSPVSVFDERQGLEGMPRSLYVENDQQYVGTSHGLFQSRDSNFERLSGFDKIPQNFIRLNGQLLFVSSNGIFEIKDEKVVQKLAFRYGKVIVPSSIHPNLLYVGTREGLLLVKADGDELTKLGRIKGLESEITTLAEDSDGNVWAGVPTKGIYQISWENVDQPLLELNIRLRATQKNRSRVFKIGNEVFFGFEQSFMTYDAERDSLVESVNLKTDYFQDENPGIFLFAEGRDNNFWIRSDEHNIKATRQKDTFIEQPSNLNLIQSNQYNFIYPDEQGKVWFGTDEGLLRYDPELEYDYDVDYQSFVREVKVLNDSLIYSGPRKEQDNHTLSYDENEVRFRYAAPTFVRKDDVEYQVFLEGFDEKWSSWTSETNKDYTNIPEGSYTFKVRARNIHNKISQAGTFDFTVLPPWYRTIWAYGLYLFVIGGVLYGIHKIRVNRIFREQRIRNRIASDLHDDVSATLSSITYFAQAIRQMKNKEQAERFVGLISESASEAKEKITDIIWSIDPENDDWVNLLAKCRRFASDLLESKNMDYELDIDTDIHHPLDLVLRQHLWLIFKEMVVNAARHSGAQKVEIRLGLQDDTLRLVVQDDGAGMEGKLANNSGHGIKNIQKRAKEIGAELQLETDPEVGTRWIMTLEIS